MNTARAVEEGDDGTRKSIKGLSGNMFSSFKGAQTGRLMVFSGQNWYQKMHFVVNTQSTLKHCFRL